MRSGNPQQLARHVDRDPQDGIVEGFHRGEGQADHLAFHGIDAATRGIDEQHCRVANADAQIVGQPHSHEDFPATVPAKWFALDDVQVA